MPTEEGDTRGGALLQRYVLVVVPCCVVTVFMMGLFGAVVVHHHQASDRLISRVGAPVSSPAISPAITPPISTVAPSKAPPTAAHAIKPKHPAPSIHQQTVTTAADCLWAADGTINLGPDAFCSKYNHDFASCSRAFLPHEDDLIRRCVVMDDKCVHGAVVDGHPCGINIHISPPPPPSPRPPSPRQPWPPRRPPIHVEDLDFTTNGEGQILAAGQPLHIKGVKCAVN